MGKFNQNPVTYLLAFPIGTFMAAQTTQAKRFPLQLVGNILIV